MGNIFEIQTKDHTRCLHLSATIGEYKGHKTISLKAKEDDRFPFTFGIGKAKLILAHLKEIQEFVDNNPKE